jgi:amino acid permease
MGLQKITSIFSCIFGFLIMLLSAYWYLISHKDISQFLAFGVIGFMLIYIGTIIFDNDKRIEKMQKAIDYFEDNLLDKFPKLKRGRT